MSHQASTLPSRRDVLVCWSAAAAGGWLLTGRSAALPPPVASKHTAIVLLTAAELKPLRTLVEWSTEFRRDSAARSPAFSPDGKLAACGGGHAYAGV